VSSENPLSAISVQHLQSAAVMLGIMCARGHVALHSKKQVVPCILLEALKVELVNRGNPAPGPPLHASDIKV
jgi:hypothetical protein